ncbi:hypothetical protein E3N88_38835 [Mikania micrantha]|uniref:Uncharacterized protein n=1 Tax=Mikania micrantha TaxID=192012 RepID=A0A5N6LV42_9ASTR|nr:hypothetical protein E3N88_38835 [Mikania micrantha]
MVLMQLRKEKGKVVFVPKINRAAGINYHDNYIEFIAGPSNNLDEKVADAIEERAGAVKGELKAVLDHRGADLEAANVVGDATNEYDDDLAFMEKDDLNVNGLRTFGGKKCCGRKLVPIEIQ